MKEQKIKFAGVFVHYENQFLNKPHIIESNFRDMMLEKSILFLNDLRALKSEIIFINSVHEQDKENLSSDSYKSFEIYEPQRESTIKAQPQESIFYGNSLHRYLRSKEITHVGICGLFNQEVLKSTLTDAVNLEYQVYSILDCQIVYEKHNGSNFYADNVQEIKSNDIVKLLTNFWN
ncbi:MAG: isochorismatase family protein [Myxococcales bacterium]|nr:isochorismatase family protein [Myxococcales bacterium]USN50364.1 MAG: isochorismatase family protein [Myxococcales bacterium]